MPTDPNRRTRWVPLIFVLLWSTGFIGAKYALPFIEPFYLLFIRMLLTVALVAGLALLRRARWPNARQAAHQMVTGTLVHGAYLGGVFAAIEWGMGAATVSLLVGLQPLLTALLAWSLLGDRLRQAQWLGLLLGLAGVALVLTDGELLAQGGISPASLTAAVVALVGISLGTLYQKRFGAGTDLLTGTFYQYLATAVWMGALTWSLEQQQVVWTAQLLLALAWLVFGLSIAAILLLMLMIREGQAARVAAYFYLVPPVTAVESWLLFGERLGAAALIGIAMAVTGVYWVIRQGAARSIEPSPHRRGGRR